MKPRINLELKHYCPDFRPIRILLKQLGVKQVITKKQKDFFFNLPPYKGRVRPRMKLRVEGSRQELIYYVRTDFSKRSAARSKLLLYFVHDKKLPHLLKEALGVRAIVFKKRELWRLDDTVFHLDRVKDVGNIFEIELRKAGLVTVKDRRLFTHYQKLFAPHLGRVISGSNGDLLSKRT